MKHFPWACSFSHSSGNAVWRTWTNMQFRRNVPAMIVFSSGKCALVLWTLSSLPSFLFSYFPFSFPLCEGNWGPWSHGANMFQHAPSRTRSATSFRHTSVSIRDHSRRTWLIPNVPAVCWNKLVRTPCFHKSPLSHLLQNNRKKMCPIHILRTSGKPSTSPCWHQQHRPPVTPGWEFQLASLM